MNVDKTLSELWHLRGNTDVVSFEELREESSNTAFMAISTIKRMQDEIERLQKVISQCRCEECGNELGNANDFSNGILCKDCLPVD